MFVLKKLMISICREDASHLPKWGIAFPPTPCPISAGHQKEDGELISQCDLLIALVSFYNLASSVSLHSLRLILDIPFRRRGESLLCLTNRRLPHFAAAASLTAAHQSHRHGSLSRMTRYCTSIPA